MCTLIVLDRVISGYPLIAAANRDEFYARPATPPQQLEADPWVVGPRDEQARGTWIGVSRDGFFAGLTNRPRGEARDPSRASRGEITLRALRAGRVGPVLSELSTLAPDAYDGFHLFCAGPDGSGVVAHGPAGYARRLDPGLHVLTNKGLNLPEDPKARRISALLEGLAGLGSVESALAALEAILADHEGENVLDRICIHSDHYGTRSATLLALHDEEPGRSIYRHTEGPSCRSPWRDVSELLKSAPSWRRTGRPGGRVSGRGGDPLEGGVA